MPTKKKTAIKKKQEEKKDLNDAKEELGVDISKNVKLKTNSELIKTCRKDGYTINLYKNGKKYFLNTNENGDLIEVSDWTANEIITKGDIYNNLRGLYNK